MKEKKEIEINEEYELDELDYLFFGLLELLIISVTLVYYLI